VHEHELRIKTKLTWNYYRGAVEKGKRRGFEWRTRNDTLYIYTQKFIIKL